MNAIQSRGLLVAVLLLSGWTANAQVSFTRTDIATGIGPQGVAVADFNGDGIADIAVINTSGSSISILLGNGDGTFQPPKTTTLAAIPSDLAVADFNRDGNQDVIVDDLGSSFSHVLLGKGDGTFQAPINVPFVFNDFAVGDLNGDGKPDLAMAGFPQGTVSIALGNGDGTFSTPFPYSVKGSGSGFGSGTIRAILSDLNRDGRLDIVAVNQDTNNISVLLGNGDGTFKTAVSYPGNPGSVFLVCVAAGDVNGDGIPDVVVGDELGVGLFLGNGDGTLQGIRLSHLPLYTTAVAIGDANGDGKPDVVAARNQGTPSTDEVFVLPGNGDGTFGTAVGFAVGANPVAVALADFNGDLNPDMVTANQADAGISLLINNYPKAVRVSPSSGAGATQTFAFTFSDPNGPGSIVSAQIDINATLAAVNTCYFYYARTANAIQLATDTGTWQTPLAIGAAGTTQNSQCSLDAGASSATTSGKLLTLNLAITFKLSFAGAKNVYMEVSDGTFTTGWVRRGTWTAGSNLMQDFSLSISPNSQTVAEGKSATYSVTATSINGFNGVVTFGTSALPSGTTGSFNPPSVAGSGSTTLSVTTTAGTTLGNSNITATGSSGSLNHQATASLDVTINGGPPSAVSFTQDGGVGSAGLFFFTFSNPDGSAGIVSAQIDISATLASKGTCYFYYAQGSNVIQLADDAGNWPAGLMLHSLGTLQNSQCLLDVGASSMSTSGTTLTLNLELSFKAAFAGAKNIYMFVQNAALNSGWVQRGTWTVTVDSPSPDYSLSMAPGSQTVAAGGSTSYTVTLTGSNGFSGTVNLGVSGLPAGVTGSFNPSSLAGSGASTLTVTTSAGGSTGTFTATVTGSSGSLVHNTSSGLTITGGGTSSGPPSAVSVTPNSGSGSAQTFAFTFSDPNGATNIVSTQMDINAVLASTGTCYFYYSRGSNVIQLADDSGNWPAGLTLGSAGTLQNSQCALNVGASSMSASGTTLTLNLALSFKAAFAGAKKVYMYVQNATLNSGWVQRGTWTATVGSPSPDYSLSMAPGSQTVAAGGSTSYTVTLTGSNGFSGVVNLSASGLPAGVTGSFNPSSLAGSGSSTLTVNTSAGGSTGTFTAMVTGSSGSLVHNTSSGLTITGGGSSSGPPSAVSVTPNSGSGSAQTFAFTFSDPNGAANIVSTQMDINAVLASTGTCFFYYSRGANAIQLADDTGNWPAGLTLGSAGTLQNSQCALNVGASSMSASGTTLTLNLALSFKAAFAGAKNIYMYVQNATLNSGWVPRGTWTATTGSSPAAAQPPAAVSVTPSSGSGLAQTFAFTFSDPAGATNIVSTQMDINATLAAAGTCYFYYGRGSNVIQLADDSGNWPAGLTLGSAGTLQNSQCVLNVGASSVSATGTTLTLNLALSFKAAFAGAKNIYMYVQNPTLNSGWGLRGIWTVP